MKKNIILVTVFLLCAMLMASCGGDSATSSSPSVGNSATGISNMEASNKNGFNPDGFNKDDSNSKRFNPGGEKKGSSNIQGSKKSGKMATITGKIKITGDDIPSVELKSINKDPEVCGKGKRKIHWYKVKEGLLGETVVYLVGDFKDASWKGSEVTTELVQEGCFFKPYMDIWKRGQEVKIISKDAAAHNIHTYERIGTARRELFNFNQPKKDTRTVTIKPKRSQFIELTCDNHDFMVGWRFVAKNPYCTIAKDGTFTLQVPPGSHTLKVWHPMMGVLEEEIEVKAGDSKTVDFEFEYEE